MTQTSASGLTQRAVSFGKPTLRRSKSAVRAAGFLCTSLAISKGSQKADYRQLTPRSGDPIKNFSLNRARPGHPPGWDPGAAEEAG